MFTLAKVMSSHHRTMVVTMTRDSDMLAVVTFCGVTEIGLFLFVVAPHDA
jgi:hypothetical protein